MVTKIPMTPEGHVRLNAELKRLKNIERPAVIKAIAEAREHGDLSENAEYHAARERQGFIEGRVMELEDKLGRAEVIDVAAQSGSAPFGITHDITVGAVPALIGALLSAALSVRALRRELIARGNLPQTRTA